MVKTRAQSSCEISFIDSVLENTNNMDEVSENIIVSLCTSLRRLEANFPDQESELNSLELNIADLIKRLDETQRHLSNSLDESKKLNKKNVTLKLLLDQQKVEMRTKLNSSLHEQDSLIEERDSIIKLKNEQKNKLSQYLSKISSLEAHVSELKNIVKEKEDLVEAAWHRIDTCNSENAKLMASVAGFDLMVKKAEERAWCDGRWVDDKILNSYYEGFSTIGSEVGQLFIGPSVAQLIMHGEPEDVAALLSQLSFKTFKHVFCCISNGTAELKQDTGSHWSLLFIDIPHGAAFHIDSAAGCNSPSAKLFFDKLNLIGFDFLESCCPQQKNSYECGLNLLVNTKLISNFYCIQLFDNPTPFQEWFEGVCLGGPGVSGVGRRVRGDSVSAVDARGLAAVASGAGRPHAHALFPEGSSKCTTNVVKSKISDDRWVKVGNKHKKHKNKTRNNICNTNLQAPNSFMSTNKFDMLKYTKLSNDHQMESCKWDKLTDVQTSLKSTNVLKPTDSSKFVIRSNETKISLTKETSTLSVNNKPTRNISCNNNNLVTQSLVDSHDNSIKVKRRVRLITDSHGRDLSKMLDNRLGQCYDVLGCVKPGAKSNHVLENSGWIVKDMNLNDTLFVIVGTNDMSCNKSPSDVVRDFHKFLSVTNNTNVRVVALPMRFDNPEICKKIAHTNVELIRAVDNYSNCKFISLDNLFNKNLFTRHGLHFNLAGKRKLAGILCNTLLQHDLTNTKNETSLNRSATIGALPYISNIQTQKRSKYYGHTNSQYTVNTQVFTNKKFTNLGQVVSDSPALEQTCPQQPYFLGEMGRGLASPRCTTPRHITNLTAVATH